MSRDPPELPPELETLASRDAVIRLVLAGLGLVVALAAIIFFMAPNLEAIGPSGPGSF